MYICSNYFAYRNVFLKYNKKFIQLKSYIINEKKKLKYKIMLHRFIIFNKYKYD